MSKNDITEKDPELALIWQQQEAAHQNAESAINFLRKEGAKNARISISAIAFSLASAFAMNITSLSQAAIPLAAFSLSVLSYGLLMRKSHLKFKDIFNQTTENLRPEIKEIFSDVTKHINTIKPFSVQDLNPMRYYSFHNPTDFVPVALIAAFPPAAPAYVFFNPGQQELFRNHALIDEIDKCQQIIEQRNPRIAPPALERP